MTEREYRAHPAVSRSDLWKFRASPQKYRYAKGHPEEPTPALLFGQLFHKVVLEPEKFSEDFAVAPNMDKRTAVGKQAWKEFLESAEGRTVVPEDLFAQAVGMAAAVENEPLAVKLLDGAREVPYFWHDAQTRLWCKCRADCANTRFSQPIIVDLKSATDASTEAFTRDAVKHGYDLQAAMYSEGVAACTGETPLFVFIVVEKNPPYAVNILQADDLFIQRGTQLLRESLEEYRYCIQSSNWYGYLGRDRQINNLGLPAWLAKELQ